MKVRSQDPCAAPVPEGCPWTGSRRHNGVWLCNAHLTRSRRGQRLDTPIKVKVPREMCPCGQGQGTQGGLCETCHYREWKNRRKLAGRSAKTGWASDQTWFDWVMVEKAAGGEALPRPLTNAERMHVLYVCIQKGWGGNAARLGERAHLSPDAAVVLAERIAAGEVKVMGRDWLGRPTVWLPKP